MNRSIAAASSTGLPTIAWVTSRVLRVERRMYLAVAETRTTGSYLSDVDRSVCLPCPRKLRVGLNSPSRCPTMFSVT